MKLILNDLKDPWKTTIRTPLIQIKGNLYAKLETVNPTGSIKDRLIQHLIKKAIGRGELTNRSKLIEATSGNTGISLAAVGASLGLPVEIIMPENMSVERRQMMSAFGAKIIYVGRSDFSAAIDKRNEMVKSEGRYWSPMQFENSENIECHALNTAQEILEQLPENNFEVFVSGAGTGGTIMGVRLALLKHRLQTKTVLVKPLEPAHMHGIQGINDGSDFLAKPSLLDLIMSVSTSAAKNRASLFARERGVLVGPSAGANLVAAERFIDLYKPRGAVVTILCDRGERYLS